MKALFFPVLVGVFILLPGTAARGDEAPDPVKLEIRDLGFPLPLSIVNQAKIARLERPELHASLPDGVPIAPQDSEAGQYHDIDVFKTSDGLIYCADSSFNAMALWVRRGDAWVCQVSNLTVTKTFGGALPWLPVRYLGKGFFAFASTCPGKVEEKSDSRFPQARAITYLLNSENGEILERSESYLYDHNPKICIPPGWYDKYGLTPAGEKTK